LRRPLSPRIENWTGVRCGPFCGRRTLEWRSSFDGFESSSQLQCVPCRAIAADFATNSPVCTPCLTLCGPEPFTAGTNLRFDAFPGQAKKTIQQTTPHRLTEADLLGLIYGLTPFPVACPKALRVRNRYGTSRRRLKVTLLSCGKTGCLCQRINWKRCCWQYEQISAGLRPAGGGCTGEVGLPSAPPAR
jgi:hypothetical protein